MNAKIDTENLEMLKEVLGDELKDIVQSYIDLLPEQLSRIVNAIESADADELKLTAHTLKGSSANVGAAGISELCYELEMKGKAGDVSGTEDTIAKLRDEADLVATFLTDHYC